MAAELPKFGDILANGATVIAAKNSSDGMIVLAHWRGEFVTWWSAHKHVNRSGCTEVVCYLGHYHGSDLLAAVRDWEVRV